MSASSFILDEGYDQSMSYSHFEMIRIAKKHYGFRPKDGYPRYLVKTYRCSHLRAIHLFKVYLIAQRLLGAMR